MKNKRAQSMSTNTVVLLIIAVLILVFLILGFTLGWKKIAPFIKSSNVDKIVDSCNAACSLQSKYDFCSVPREVKGAEKGDEVTTTCVVLATLDSEFSKYGIEDCSIDCGLSCADIKIDEVAGDSALTEGTYDVSSIAKETTCFIK